MLLSDVNIRDEMSKRGLEIRGVAEGAIGPASVDLMLSNAFVNFSWGMRGNLKGTMIDPKRDHSEDGQNVVVPRDDYYVLAAGDFCLASTVERWRFPNHLAGRLEGKSSLGRLGLLVHTTAGFFDPGFEGYPTLELVNLRDRPIKLYPGMPIAQMSVFSMVSPCSKSYADGGKYADQGPFPVQSKYHLNWQGSSPDYGD